MHLFSIVVFWIEIFELGIILQYELGENFGKFEIENLVEKCFPVLFQILQWQQNQERLNGTKTVTCLKHFLIPILKIAKFEIFQ